MKKIAIVVPTLGKGGGEKLAYDLAMQINKSQFHVYVICLFPRQNNLREEQLEAANIKLIFLNKKRGLDLSIVPILKKHLKIIKPDVIHSHLDVLFYLFFVYKNKMIKIHTVHSMAQYEAPGIHKIIRWIAFKLWGVCPVAIGEEVRKSISEYYGLRENEIAMIYNGINIAKAPRQIKDCKRLDLVSIGSLTSVKNHSLQLLAVKELKENYRIPIHLTLVGDGILKEQLKDQIREYGIENNVRFVGWQDNVQPFLAQADIYLCTSLMEGVSLAIIEAMSQGLPVIATDVGGNRDLVCNGRTGILVPLNEVDKLVAAILQLYRDSDMRNAMAERAMVAAQKYDIRICTAEYEHLYENSN